MQASGQESWPFSSSLKPDVTPGLPPFLKVYLKKKISFIFHFFSRDESKVNRENSGDYKPFLMATLIDHFLKTCMRDYILNFGHPVRGLIPTIRGSQRENICMPTLVWKNISSISYLTRKCVCSLFFFPFLFQLA